jgi:hypothetical protein
MVAINTQGSKARLLQEGINAIATDYYNDLPTEYSKIFETHNSEKSYELDVAVSNGGLASLKPEGGEIGYDDSKQDFTQTYNHAVYAIGAILTMEAQMNNKYEDLVETTAKWLKRSIVHTDEQLAANVINDGYTSSNGMDGVPLFSTAHLLGKGGTFSNRFSVLTSLSQSAVEDALIALEDFRDGANLLIDAKGVSLHIPRQLRFVAAKINDSVYEPNTANTATVNPVSGIFTEGTHVNHRFSSSTDWLIKTNVDDGFKIFDRMGYKFSEDNDFGTENFRSKVMLYKSYGFTDPRCAWGSGT